MAVEVSYVLITPYSLVKSRTGGILSRLLSRTDLELIGAQMLAFDKEHAEQYAHELEESLKDANGKLLADYVRENFRSHDDGRKERTFMLLFKGEDACAKLTQVVGRLSHRSPRDFHIAESIRDTYADMVEDRDNPEMIRYFEPAVLTPPNFADAVPKLRMLAEFARRSPNIVDNSVGGTAGDERTLVIIKPENWRAPSSRPGAVIDMLSRTGLRIVGCKVYRMSVADALEFYGPVQEALRSKLAPKIGEKAYELLREQYRIDIPESSKELLTQAVGIPFADDQFAKIIEFMSGRNPITTPVETRAEQGVAQCLVLIYEGKDAVAKIRSVLGPTDPGKAPGGTVRRDFGSDVMVNTAHASDSHESFVRETGVVRIMENHLAGKALDFLASLQ